MSALKSRVDRRHALRVAVERATTEIIDAFWDEPAEKIDRLYGNLLEGRLSVEWTLTHPDDIEAIAEDSLRLNCEQEAPDGPDEASRPR